MWRFFQCTDESDSSTIFSLFQMTFHEQNQLNKKKQVDRFYMK